MKNLIQFNSPKPAKPTDQSPKKHAYVTLVALLAAISLLLSAKQAKAESLIVEIPPEPTNQPVAPGLDTIGSQLTPIATEPAGVSDLAGVVLSPGSTALIPAPVQSQSTEPLTSPPLPLETRAGTYQPGQSDLVASAPPAPVTTDNSGLVIISAPEPEADSSRRHMPGTPPGSAAQLLPAPQITAGSEAANLIITNSGNDLKASETPAEGSNPYPQDMVILPALSNLDKTRSQLVPPDKIEGTEQKPDDDKEAQRQWIVQKGKEVAAEMNITFQCAAGVQVALDRAGFPEFMGSGDGWEMRYAFLQSPKWRVTDDPNKATAFVREWTPEVVASYGDRYQGRNLGHVGILYKENDQLYELSDHKAQFHPDSPRYAKTIYFEYVG